jgi:magnesium chelatase subunit D
LAEAKGAVELLLADCYVQRDRVALVAFRGAQADVLLPPTRSLVRARRSLTALPGGGGTPLAAGIAAADRLAEQVQREAGQSALVVLLTDARANVALDGLGGREQAMDDALRCARRLRGHATPALMIDTGTRPDARGRALAQAMAARHVVLPQANAASLHRVVHAAMRDSPASPR